MVAFCLCPSPPLDMVIGYPLLFDAKLRPRAHLKSNKVTPAWQGAELAKALITIMPDTRSLQGAVRTSRARAGDAASHRLLHQPLGRANSPGEPLLRGGL